jgi:hypothetical protein
MELVSVSVAEAWGQFRYTVEMLQNFPKLQTLLRPQHEIALYPVPHLILEIEPLHMKFL